MITATTLNKSEIPAAGRPVSLLAALGVLGASLYISHVGLVAVFKAGELAGVMTALLVCLSTLQWMAMGRARAARAAGAASQAGLTVGNAALLFALESTLNAVGVVMLAEKAGSDWGSGPALIFAIAIAAGVAWLNLTVKFAACEPLVSAEPRAAAVVLEDEPPPAARVPNVYDLDDVRRARELATSDERAGLRTIVAGEAAHRAEEYARHLSRIDPVTKKFKAQQAHKAAEPKRRRKVA